MCVMIGIKSMKRIKIKQFISVSVLVIIHSIFLVSVIAPDYVGLWVDGPAQNIIYYIPAILTALYFALLNFTEKGLARYFIKTILSSLFVVFVSFILILPISLKVNSIRCAQFGFCTGGEPYDYMSTIFLIIFSFSSAIRVVVLAIVLGAVVKISRK